MSGQQLDPPAVAWLAGGVRLERGWGERGISLKEARSEVVCLAFKFGSVYLGKESISGREADGIEPRIFYS